MPNAELTGIIQDFKNIKIVRYYAETYNKYDMEAHTHKAGEYMYSGKGNCFIHIYENGKEKIIKLKEKGYIYIAPYIKHRLVVMAGLQCRVLNLEIQADKHTENNLKNMLCNSEYYLRFLKEIYGYAVCHDSHGIMHNNINQLQRLLEESKNNKQDFYFEQAVLIANIYLLTAKQYYEKNSKNNGRTKHVRQALKFIHENFDKNISIAEIASYACISQSHLQRIFHAELNLTIGCYINNMRIEKARHLLLTSNLSVNDIAVEAGYNSRQIFNSNFKANTGFTPAEFRKNKGGKNIPNTI